jgi:phospholipid-binding lipoprotein MlaA
MRCLIAFLLAWVLVGCATPGNNYDPLEPINRPIYSLNKGVDTVALRPLANTWKEFMPEPVQQGVHNFFENISDVFAIPAAALQGKFKDAGSSMLRVLANTTLGMAGLFDVASDMEIPKSNEDFGQALGYWGVPTGPYLVLPLLGPTTARDVVDPAIHLTVGPTRWIEPDGAAYAYMGMNAIDLRTQLLPLDKVLAEQYDEYTFVRDTYLQRRWFKVHDGNPPHPLPMGNDEADAADNEVAKPVASKPASASAPAAVKASSPSAAILGAGQP